MKRKILLSLLTMTSAVLTLTGCGEPDHVHTWATTWSTNSTQHWVIATCHPEVCSYLGNHTDENNDGYCDACGYKMSGENPDPEHIHTYATSWTTSEAQHWHAATCGHDVKSDLGSHVDNGGDGYCDLCNYKMSGITPIPPSSDVEAYYAGINPDSSTLLNDLNSLNNSYRRTIGWDGLRYVYNVIDADPNGSGKIVGFYDNKLIGPSWDQGKTWNREHVWPDALGGNSVEGDAHMTRPAWKDSNSDRGCMYYAASGAYDPGSLNYNNYRGIAARIIFYCCIANTNLKLVDALSGGKNQMGKLSDLLKWNLEYLPNTSETAALELRVEQNRNNTIALSKYQGNRNPFIDHPEYACKIWGTTNSETRRICGI